jgi:HSP20 family molecular chaperone IbpA
MARSDFPPGFLADAFEVLRDADRMQRRFFTVSLGHTGPAWEPPVDLVESGRQLLIQVALPGVRADSLEVRTDGTSLHVAALRRLHAARGDVIHRLEIPYGRFDRRIELPRGRYEIGRRELADGLLTIELLRVD